MRRLLIVLCVAGCGGKTVPRGQAGSAETEPAVAPARAATPAPAGAAVAQVPADAPAAAVAKGTCCCESTGDATHYTIEGDPSACTADDMRGECVGLDQCGLAAAPRVLAPGVTVTIDAGGLLAIWPTAEAKAYAAIEIEPAGKKATVRTNGSNDGDEPWKKQVSIPTAPGPLTITAQPDGTALVTNGKTTWVLTQQYRYGEVTFAKRK